MHSVLDAIGIRGRRRRTRLALIVAPALPAGAPLVALVALVALIRVGGIDVAVGASQWAPLVLWILPLLARLPALAGLT
jgi:hypothetical protein